MRFFATEIALLAKKRPIGPNQKEIRTLTRFVEIVSVRLTARWQARVVASRHALLDDMPRKGFRFGRVATPVRDTCKQ